MQVINGNLDSDMNLACLPVFALISDFEYGLFKIPIFTPVGCSTLPILFIALGGEDLVLFDTVLHRTLAIQASFLYLDCTLCVTLMY